MGGCALGAVGSRLLAGSWVRLGPPQCHTKRATIRLTGAGPIIMTHADCVCNEERALKLRHLIDTGARYTYTGDLYVHLQQLLPPEVLTPWSFQAVIDHYAGGKRIRYMRARENLRKYGFRTAHANVRMFLKDDKYLEDGLKEPRCIQYRAMEYCLLLGRYVHAIEKHVYQAEVNGSRVIAKGMNSYERAQWVVDAWNSFDGPVAVLLDHSKYDAHVSVPLLDIEHRFYRACFGPNKWLARLLALQLVNKGYTKNGTRYMVKGTRMSGDVNTGLGNSVVNYAMLAEVLGHLPGRILVDGDDSIIITSTVCLTELRDRVQKMCPLFGMETKADLAFGMQEVEFCQCRPVELSTGWRMVRNPERVIQRSPWTTRNYNEKGNQRLLRTIGLCELACNNGVPVLQAYSQDLASKGHGRVLQDHWSARALLERGTGVQPITAAARMSFYQAWGITPEQQVTMEKGLWHLEW